MVVVELDVVGGVVCVVVVGFVVLGWLIGSAVVDSLATGNSASLGAAKNNVKKFQVNSLTHWYFDLFLFYHTSKSFFFYK